MQTFAGLFGVNRLFVGRGLANPTSHFVVAPNHDTVYALAILDLRDGPYVLEVPAIPDRYHVFQFLDRVDGRLRPRRHTHDRRARRCLGDRPTRATRSDLPDGHVGSRSRPTRR